MTSQQPYHAYAQNKGTLSTGQFIYVNKFNVQVERYLSQGKSCHGCKSISGFAHVYLVRTATPVYNTTHHVLKRIAVANEAMLAEVKKEVDIMRLLKGHPNIVHLIDAAWHKMPDGMYEVFILMEFCPGGGIIDMMNRRLRERLTEAEILQIFVDVCEGVAFMHNSRPPLLHRDLKVENILQSTPTSFKLCDFGSATTVTRPPTTTQEIRALEAELNRHTTLQYRAPEMVDPYSRKPVDEKSDVWALGVLLYKLCYYTTPFEEHGPLAILNVQYRIPPYPVYSTRMTQLIGLMLQEHGIRRPTVFELLAHVHGLRGTKSRFQYTIPSPQPLSPRHQSQFKPSSLPNYAEHTAICPRAHPMASDSKKPDASIGTSPSPNQGVQARERVLEAIAPMRRGRPASSKGSHSISRPESPQKYSGTQTLSLEEEKQRVDKGFIWEDSKARKAAVVGADGLDDAWKVDGGDQDAGSEKMIQRQGFGDDFAEQLWDSFDPNTNPQAESKPSSGTASKPDIIRIKTSAPSSSTHLSTTVHDKDKDAFEGLGLRLSSDKPAPTLGEARKLRTGLAVANSNMFQYDNDRPGSTSARPSPSPRQPQLQLQPHSLSPPTPSSARSDPSWRVSPQPVHRPSASAPLDGLSAENRFPSLEELDATFTPNPAHRSSRSGDPISQQYLNKTPVSAPQNNNTNRSKIETKLLKPIAQPITSHGQDGTRSQQVTGVAMRESRGGHSGRDVVNGGRDTGESRREETKITNASMPTDRIDIVSRPTLTRKHRSSITIKHSSRPSVNEDTPTSPTLLPSIAQNLSPPSPRLPASRSPKDWLTGEEDNHDVSSAHPADTPVLRESPRKRASVIQKSIVPIQDAVVAQHDHVPAHKPTPSPTEGIISPTLSRFTRTFPPIDTSNDVQQDVVGDLTENWSPVTARIPLRRRETETSSSTDEEPEDAGGFRRAASKPTEKDTRRRRNGRQSSVHDLVDLWGGGSKEKEREAKLVRNNAELPAHGHKIRPAISPLLSAKSNPNPRSASPRSTSSSQGFDISTRHPTSASGRHRPTVGAPSPSPTSRSRPQSMFIFPSKSVDSISPPSAGHLAVPAGLVSLEEPKQRTNIRRTSISDMVQRYEDISGNLKFVGAGLPQSPAPVSNLGGKISSENGRYSRRQLNSESDRVGMLLSVPSSLSPDSSVISSGSATDLGQTAPDPPRISPVGTKAPSHQRNALHQETGNYVHRARTSSFKPEVSKPAFHSHRSTEEPTSRSGDGGSSSPERPYQGVGKLIDQWQRKTAEAGPPPAVAGNKRSGFVAKRAGIIHSATGRD